MINKNMYKKGKLFEIKYTRNLDKKKKKKKNKFAFKGLTCDDEWQVKYYKTFFKHTHATFDIFLNLKIKIPHCRNITKFQKKELNEEK